MASNAINGKFYSSEHLASSSVKTICQDSYGFIWIGTNHGLSRFDGYRFTNYYHVHRDSTSLPENNIGCILTDKNRNLWIGQGLGLVRYDYATNRFLKMQFPNNIALRVSSMAEDESGNIFIGTAGFGMYMMAQGTDTIRRAGEFSDELNNMFVGHMRFDSHGNLWTSNHKNMLYLYTMKDGQMQAYREFKSEMGEPMAFVDEGHDVLIVCKKGIMRYDYVTGSLADAGYDLKDSSDIGSKTNAMLNYGYMDEMGTLYLGTYGRGLLTIKRGEKTARQVTLQQNHLQLSTPFISYITKDKDNHLWLSCFDQGIFLTSHQNPAFDSWSLTLHDPQFAGRVTSIAADADGGSWCTIRQGALYHLDRHGNILSRISTQPELQAVCWEQGQRYWFGTGNTLNLLDATTGKTEKKYEFDGSGIAQIISDGGEHLYVSVYSKGFYRYNIGSGDVQPFNAGMDGPHGKLSNNWVGAMMIDSRKLLWASTSSGVSCLNPQDDSFNSLGWNALLQAVSCGPLCETKEHDIVIGSSDGLYIYRRATNKVERFPDSELLEDVSIGSIVEDGKGDLWISTSQGIWQYNRQQQCFVNYLNGNGLSTKEYIAGAAIEFADGRIAFGKRDGLTVFNPSVIKSGSINIGKVCLTRFLRDGTPVDFRSDIFTIPYDENSFSMEFSLLDYESTENISFQYRLNEGQWISTNKGDNVISFGKMKPGTYHIDVRAECNGVISSELLTVTVEVLNPWYLSTWAVVAYLLVAALIMGFLVRNYNQRKRREMDEEKMKFLINATHDIRSPLTLIMAGVEKLKSLTSDSAVNTKDSTPTTQHPTPIIQDAIATVDRNAQRLMLLVNQILDERKIDKNQMQLHCRETNLVEFITGICKLYQYNASQRNITFTFEHEKDHVLAWVDRINFDKVISNLLSNAFKYTYDGGEVKVVLKESDRDIEIQVIDDGMGIKDEDKERLFDRFYQGHNADSLGMQGTGIGLNLSHNIVKMHGGQMKAQNRPDDEQGACFIVIIPKGNRHLKPEQIVTDSPARDVLSSGGKQPCHQAHILIADDDPEIANYIVNELGDKYKFDHAVNGKEALKTLLTGQYDLVVSDVMMPEMDGITLLRRIKDNPNISQLPVIMLTSKAAVDDRLEGLKSGADAYIPKPFNMDELHIQIDNLIDNVRRLRGKFSGALQQEERVENIEVKGNDDALMERIMRSVNAHLADPEYNVDTLATDVGISRAQLHRKMKEMTGVATGRFLRNLRMEQAARLLREGKVNVSQVADSVGYIDQSHFSTAFKSHFGLSPSEYAEANKES
jgi:signal transduction histidine kinase/DNA-binding response OmpR family regulator/ligand-binding sensor domain-containing protein